MNLFNVENKVILITGGGVLGGQMSEYLLGNGATVVILDYKNEIVDVAVENLKKISNKVAGLVCNVMEEESLQKVSDTIIQQLMYLSMQLEEICLEQPLEKIKLFLM